MSGQQEWLNDLAAAADECGYGIEIITPRRVTLILLRSKSDVRVTIESHFLSGALIRQLLKPQEPVA